MTFFKPWCLPLLALQTGVFAHQSVSIVQNGVCALYSRLLDVSLSIPPFIMHISPQT